MVSCGFRADWPPMTTDTIRDYAFQDTEVFVRFGFRYTSTPFRALRDLIDTGRLKLVITDVVIREVESRIRKAVHGAVAAHRRYLKEEGKVLESSDLDAVKAHVIKLDSEAIVKDLTEAFHKFLSDCKTTTLGVASVTLSDILDDYFEGRPPFAATENKKSEFPDAISVAALVEWSDDQSVGVFVVSGDKGFREACDEKDWLYPHETLQEMLNEVANDEEKRAEFIRAQVTKSNAQIEPKVIAQFEDRYFFLLDENGDAEVNVTSAELLEVNILEADNTQALVDVSYRLDSEVSLSYDDPNMTVRDDDTGDLMSFGTVEETVQRTFYTRAEVQVALDGLDEQFFEIEDVTLTEPKDALGISVEEDPRAYK
jgi:hypothetical protein